MRACHYRLAIAAGLSLMTTLLAGCGQTGPLYMPDNQAARERYDPGNAYGTQHPSSQQHHNASNGSQGSDNRQTDQSGHSNATPVGSTLGSEGTGQNASSTSTSQLSSASSTSSSASASTAATASTPKTSTTTSESSSSDQQNAVDTNAAKTKASNLNSHESSDQQNSWEGIQFTPYSAATEGDGLDIESGTSNNE